LLSDAHNDKHKKNKLLLLKMCFVFANPLSCQ